MFARNLDLQKIAQNLDLEQQQQQEKQQQQQQHKQNLRKLADW